MTLRRRDNIQSGNAMFKESSLFRKVAKTWVVVAGIAYAFDLWRKTGNSLIDASGRPLGDDFINYWSGAFLAWHSRAAEIYHWPAYHAFQQGFAGAEIAPYHYGYPPVLLILTAPLAALPYLPGLAVWLVTSWICFHRALVLAIPGRSAMLLALATPAIFVNAVGGQNGAWTAAFFGGGLSLLERRPMMAGVLFGLLIYKPHLGLLIPVALLAGGHWRAAGAAAATAGGLILASLLLFGSDAWREYSHIVSVIRQVILEDGAGVWHRMISVFVFARRLGADVQLAYIAQAVTGVIAAIIVARAWASKDAPAPLKNSLLVLGTFLATPYLQDYDLVVGAFVAVWLTSHATVQKNFERPALLASLLVLLLPIVAAPLAQATGLALGCLFVILAFTLVARAVLSAQPGVPAEAIR